MGKFQNIVAMWSGTLGNVPANWQLCDGTNGTPDLTQRFVIGSQGDLAIGDTGGATTHTHAFTTDGHDHDIDPGPGFNFNGAYSDFTDTVEVTGTTDPNVPTIPWYSLAFIMRMS